MKQGPHTRVPFRRRREGRTDYRHRLRMLRSEGPRAVVRRTLNNVIVQIVVFEPKGDVIVASANSKELVKLGWDRGTGNVPAAYFTGYLAGKRALAKDVRGAVLDIGLHTPTKGGRVFATLKGLVDAGVAVPHSPEVLPSDERLRGEHIGPETAQAFQAFKDKLGGT